MASEWKSDLRSCNVIWSFTVVLSFMCGQGTVLERTITIKRTSVVLKTLCLFTNKNGHNHIRVTRPKIVESACCSIHHKSINNIVLANKLPFYRLI